MRKSAFSLTISSPFLWWGKRRPTLHEQGGFRSWVFRQPSIAPSNMGGGSFGKGGAADAPLSGKDGKLPCLLPVQNLENSEECYKASKSLQ